MRASSTTQRKCTKRLSLKTPPPLTQLTPLRIASNLRLEMNFRMLFLNNCNLCITKRWQLTRKMSKQTLIWGCCICKRIRNLRLRWSFSWLQSPKMSPRTKEWSCSAPSSPKPTTTSEWFKTESARSRKRLTVTSWLSISARETRTSNLLTVPLSKRQAPTTQSHSRNLACVTKPSNCYVTYKLTSAMKSVCSIIWA